MSEEIDRWVKFMKDNPASWKSKHTEFVDAQFFKSREFIRRLLKTPRGKEKVISVYNIKNLNGYRKLLN